MIFGFGARPDAKDSSRTIAALGQGGLSLPDRDYYLKEDAKSVEIRQRYLQHIKNMFVLAGDAPETAAAKAHMVLDCETVIAKASLDRVSHARPQQDLPHDDQAGTGRAGAGVSLGRYFKATGAPAFDSSTSASRIS